MKLSQYMPELPTMMIQQHNNLSSFMNNMEAMKAISEGQGHHGRTSEGRETYRAASLGLDVNYGSWIGQEFTFRQQLVAQIQEFTKNTEEVRSPIHHIINEVFRRGIHWKPKFAVKCETCGTSYENMVEQCEVCDGEVEDDEDEQAPMNSLDMPTMGTDNEMTGPAPGPSGSPSGGDMPNSNAGAANLGLMQKQMPNPMAGMPPAPPSAASCSGRCNAAT